MTPSTTTLEPDQTGSGGALDVMRIQLLIITHSNYSPELLVCLHAQADYAPNRVKRVTETTYDLNFGDSLHAMRLILIARLITYARPNCPK